MVWFNIKKKSLTKDKNNKKKDIPKGTFQNCPVCNEAIYKKNFIKYYKICQKCGFHFKLNAFERIEITFDENTFNELFNDIVSSDPLNFTDVKSYPDRIKASIAKTGIDDAIVVGTGEINGRKVAAGIMDFGFMGGSMGSVLGEKISLIMEHAYDNDLPVIIFSTSGGARMQEGILSLMQMGKTSAAIQRHSSKGLLYISVCCNPTTGGTSASFAMLGDIIIGEPEALIGFAGPRVIEQTIKQKLPPKFQTSEFLLEKGFLDMVVKRAELKDTLFKIIDGLV